ncbi:MAG: hypothetical protein K0Q58_948, partial [Microbacterium sp.]|nr:hypothetical protein [Microbacterium sp.]
MPKPRKPTEPSQVYRHLRAVFGDPSKRGTDARRRRAREFDADTVPYGRGREPKGLPVTIEDGALVIRCDSTAWATQLRLMRATVTTTIAERHPEAGVESIRVSGPDAPTWKRGPRTVQGRGPRDTYG